MRVARIVEVVERRIYRAPVVKRRKKLSKKRAVSGAWRLNLMLLPDTNPGAGFV
jgi:hypothetical protein